MESFLLALDDFMYNMSYPMPKYNWDTLPKSRKYGGWYIEPHYHIIESSLLTIFFVIAIIYLYPKQPKLLREYNKCKGNNGIFYHIIGILLTIDYVFHIYTKFIQPEGLRGLFWLFQPCCYNHTSLVVLYWFPNVFTYRYLNHILIWSMGSWQGCIFADTQDKHVIKWDYEHFWVQHYLLVIFPYILLYNNMDYVYYNLNKYSMLVDTWLLGVYHFMILQNLCYVSGLNLNYLMLPPPNTPLIKFGKYYRFFNTIAMAIVCQIFGWLFPYLFCKICYIFGLKKMESILDDDKKKSQ